MLKSFALICICMFNGIAAGEPECSSQLSKNITDQTQASVVASFIHIAKHNLDEAVKYISAKASCTSDDCVCMKPMDCAEILDANKFAESGIYKIWPRSRVSEGPRDVYCDMEDDGGSWTVIQRRGNFDSGKDYFYKDWNAYKNGFGDIGKDFWLGNDNIFALTNQRNNILKFTLSDWDGNNTYATFDTFWIEDETRKYVIHVSGYRGTAGDSFSSTNGLDFTTKDRDNDKFDKNCAEAFKGAWWYGGCHESNLNGWYLKGVHESFADGVEWHTFKGYNYSLKDTVMKIRPKSFKKNAETITPR